MLCSVLNVSSLLLVVLIWSLEAHASPQFRRQDTSIRTLSASQISAYMPYTYYASAGYCKPAKTITWKCGVACDANPTFTPISSGGDGAVVQFWYVGTDPILKTVIVGHQGTDAAKIIPVLTDAEVWLEKPNQNYFQGMLSDVQIHHGFLMAQIQTADNVLSVVRVALQKSGFNQVTLVGHSLGAALALLDGVFLSLQLPKDVKLRVVGYGMPRVGNQAFADYADQHLDITHINNRQDPVPTFPDRYLGYVQPNGEKHMTVLRWERDVKF